MTSAGGPALEKHGGVQAGASEATAEIKDLALEGGAVPEAIARGFEDQLDVDAPVLVPENVPHPLHATTAGGQGVA